MESSELEKEVVETKVILGRMDERLANIENALRRDYHALHGNGAPGIVERVTNLEASVNSTWRTIQTAGTVVMAVISLVVSMLAMIKR